MSSPPQKKKSTGRRPIMRALLWKNWRLKTSRPASTCFELLMPPLLVFLFSILKGQTDIIYAPAGWTEVSTTSLAGSSDIPCPYPMDPLSLDRACVYPFPKYLRPVATLSELYEDRLSVSRFARVLVSYDDSGAKSEADKIEAQNFLEQFLEWGKKVNGAGNPLSPFALSTFVFGNGTQSEAEDYMRSGSYGQPFDSETPRVAGMIVFSKLDQVNENYEYTIRLNSTQGGPPLRTRNTRGEVTRDVDPQFRPEVLRMDSDDGFMSLQLLVDQFLVGGGKDDTPLTPQIFNTLGFPVEAYSYDEFYDLVTAVFALFYILVFQWPVASLLSALVSEKETRMREMMKMMGVSDFQLFGSWFITYTIFFVVEAILITIASASLFPSTLEGGGGLLIFLLFLLFGLSTMAFCYTLSAFFWKARTAAIVGVTAYFIAFFPYNQISDVTNEKPIGLLLLPQVAFALGVQTLSSLEGSGAGVSWENAGVTVEGFEFGTAIGMLFFDMIFYTVLGWYLDKVVPQEVGGRQPVYFFLLPSYWSCGHIKGSSVRNSDLDAEAVDVAADDDRVQPVSAYLRDQITGQKCVQIKNLRKVFGSSSGDKVAVKNLSMEMYEGQILALLGHNGAGKTTTLSMLSGMLSPSGGTAVVRGQDITEDMQTIRQSLGFCPQHDVLYKELTVTEHLSFYGLVKGLKGKELKDAVDVKIREVGLTEKRNARTKDLSGGQKRKLSVAIALIGDSTVVFLDEPTSGMDPYSRRSTWELLQNNREGRVMVLTTHFMDEADILGDRIAIMAEGELRCHGDSLFLKSRFGEGYTLTIVKTPDGSSKGIKDVVLGQVHGAKILSDVGTELTFQMPIRETGSFAALFERLDNDKVSLGVEQYGVSVTTMEEVFLKVASSDEAHGRGGDNGDFAKVTDTDDSTVIADNADASISDNSTVDEGALLSNDKGAILFVRHFRAMYLKRFRYAKRDWKTFCCVAMLPIIMVTLALSIVTFSPFGTDSPGKALDLSDYNPKYKNDRVALPFVANNDVDELADNPGQPSNVMRSEYFGTEILLQSVVLNNTQNQTLFDRKYRNGQAVLCTNCNNPDPITGQSILSLTNHLFESKSSADSMLNGTSQYIAAVIERKTQSGRKRCFSSSLLSIFGAGAGAGETEVITCADPNDPCAYISSQFIPGLPATCVPLGCASDAVQFFNPAVVEEILNDVIEAVDTNPGVLPQAFEDLLKALTPADLIATMTAYGCDADRCNFDFGTSAGGGAVENPCLQEVGSTEVREDMVELLPVVGEQSDDGLDAFYTYTICEDGTACEIGSAYAEGDALVPRDCIGFDTATCDSTDNCVSEEINGNETCIDDCSYKTASVCGTSSQCEWSEFFCARSCLNLPTSDSCGSSLESLGIDCTWSPIDNSCKARKRFSITAMVNTTSLFGGPVLMNVIDSALLRARSGKATASIKVINKPLPFTKTQLQIIDDSKALITSIFIIIGYAFVPAAVMGYVVLEKEKVKHQQFVSGVGPISYWAAMFAFDMTTFMVPMVATVALIKLFGVDSFGDPEVLGAIVVVLLGFGLSVMPFTYLMSHVFSKHTTAQNVALLFNLMTGLVLMITSFVLDVLETTKDANVYLKYVWRLFPGFCLGDSFLNLSVRGILAAFVEGFDQSPYQWDVTGINLIYLYVGAFVFLVAAVGVDIVKTKPSLWTWRAKLSVGENELAVNNNHGEVEVDEDVAAERERVGAMIEGLSSSTPAEDKKEALDTVTIVGLRKEYGKKKVAVKNVTLGIKEGECFGYLGINGAGKTSTMKCLTGDVYPTKGTAFVSGFDIMSQSAEVRQLIGYCPQFDALLDLLTVREHLEMYASIKGVPKEHVERVIQRRMKEMTLLEFENKMAKTLSGGNKRKLSVAIAMIGQPRIVLLDEPSTGMDPVSRRFMWGVISAMTKSKAKTSVILTTHSMEECEALCNRVAIMISGGLRCLGTVQHLKSRFGNGLMVDVTVAQPSQAALDALAARHPELPALCVLSDIQTLCKKEVDNGDAFADVKLASITSKGEMAFPIYHALQVDQAVSSDVLLAWWLVQTNVHSLLAFMENNFSGYGLVESHDTHYRLRIPKVCLGDRKLGAVFKLFEENKSDVGIAEYSVSQTSLEQIFNQFAATQTEETGKARGVNNMNAVLG